MILFHRWILDGFAMFSSFAISLRRMHEVKGLSPCNIGNGICISLQSITKKADKVHYRGPVESKMQNFDRLCCCPQTIECARRPCNLAQSRCFRHLLGLVWLHAPINCSPKNSQSESYQSLTCNLLQQPSKRTEHTPNNVDF